MATCFQCKQIGVRICNNECPFDNDIPCQGCGRHVDSYHVEIERWFAKGDDTRRDEARGRDND